MASDGLLMNLDKARNKKIHLLLDIGKTKISRGYLEDKLKEFYFSNISPRHCMAATKKLEEVKKEIRKLGEFILHYALKAFFAKYLKRGDKRKQKLGSNANLLVEE